MCIPDDRAQTRNAYDAVADAYANLLPGLDAEAYLDRALIDDFADRCQEAMGLVADVGCGTGRVSSYLAARGVDIFGLDLSSGMVEVARRRHPHLRFEVGQMEDLSIPDAGLAGLVAWYSLIHSAPDRLSSIVGEFARVLRPGGWLLTAFQTGGGESVHRETAYGRSVTMTNYRHAPEHVLAVLDAGGFGVHVEFQRQAEGPEATPQSILLARRR